MDDKVTKHMASKGKEVCKQQGGTNLNAGPNSKKAPAKSGDAVTNPTRFTAQDDSLDQGGGTKNPHLPI